MFFWKKNGDTIYNIRQIGHLFSSSQWAETDSSIHTIEVYRGIHLIDTLYSCSKDAALLQYTDQQLQSIVCSHWLVNFFQ